MSDITTRTGKGAALTHSELDDNFTNLNNDKAELSGADFTGNISVDGNISVTGTVDGRDVAADGTKLDGVEANADVTDTANVTAAGALMDSEVTNLADVKSFDPADYATAAQGTTADSALQNVSEDTTPQLGGNLDVNGQSIVSTSNGDINITPNGTGNVSLGNLTFDADQTVGAGQDNYVLTYDNTSGNISLEAATGGGSTYELDISADTGTGTITDAETLVMFGSVGINTSMTNNTLAISADIASDTVKGIASFDSSDFTVTSGNVAITDSPSFTGLTVDTNTLKVDSTNNRVGILNATPDVTLDVGSATDAVHVPVGTTAQRPSTPAAGYLRYNSTTGEFEGYTTTWGSLGSGSSQSDIFVDTMTGDGSTTTLTLTNGAATENNTQVYIDGVYQSKSNYSLSGTTITFSTAPPNLSDVEVITIEPTTINEPADGSVTSAKLSGDLTTPGNLSVTGNVTLTGTVDGRDIATDGTKLDGIEALADVTDTANVTAAGALMDSEVTNLEQVKAFDSADYATAAQGTAADSAMQDLVDDTTPQLGGDLDVNGNSIVSVSNGDITLAPNGTGTVIVDADQASQNVIIDGGIRLDAQSGGADDIGVFVKDASTTNASPTVRVQGQRDSANVSQVFAGGLLLNKLRGDQKITDQQHVGTIYFGGNHTDGTEANVAFGASISGLATGDYDSASDMPTSLVFYTGSTGRAYPTANVTTGDEAMRIDHTGKVYVNTTTSPLAGIAMLTAQGGSAYGAGIAVTNDGSANGWARMEFVNDQATQSGIIFRDNTGTFGFRNNNSSGTATYTDIIAGDTTAGHIRFRTATTTQAMHITPANRVGIGNTNPSTILDVTGTVTATSFAGSGSNLTGVLTNVKSFKTFMTADATVNGSTTFTTKNVFNTTPEINVGGFTVAASGVTVPEAGVYVVMANMMYNSTVVRANPAFRFLINSTGQAEEALSSYIRSGNGHNEASSSLSTMYNLSANDVIGIQFAQEAAAGTVNLETGSHIAIYRVA